MPDEEKGFVSRRGRRVSLSRLDMEELQIDNVPGEVLEPVTTLRSDPPKEPTHRPWGRILISIVVLLLIPAVAGEYITRQYATSGDITKQRFKELVSRQVAPLQAKNDLSAATVTIMANDIESLSARMCKGGLLDNMASLYPRAAAAHKQCTTEQEKYSALAGALRSYASERDYLEKLQNVLKPLSQPLPERFAVIGSQLELWRTAEDALKKLSPPASLRPLQDNTYRYTYAVMEDWSKLNTAYNEKKGSEFVALQKKMKQDYGSLQANATTVTSVLETSQLKVTNAYKAIGQ